ncbi:four-carbon acid sugar kinase family protein [Halalkalibacter oceani]|uniref:Four-carbon acid sugar kinase family protein n=1 Tax=Halalkalibacter oceani TaxID=1653776 RepID=A0A9X2IP59_9BACI|nr:four-carbon acid sugar kinase family protein [Halalkalibacter oceani]MCM3714516.1 four-carbon acid sugar kinase family protein [Halalkalibacter oceani]
MIVIADDLTGANDTGVQFVKQGKPTIVHLTSFIESLTETEKVNVINTDSRSLSPDEAYKRNRELAKKMKGDQQPFIYKKVDSTLRGNIGQEIDGLMDELSFSFCAVVPAYPQNGRLTIGGYHLVHGTLLEDSELANDVKFPMTESFIPDLLAGQTKRSVGLIGVKTLRRGKLAEEVDALLARGVEVIVFDSAIDADLKTVTDFLKTQEKVLWVGSAGLAQAFTSEQAQKLTSDAEEQVEKPLPTLTVAGSVSTVTRKQIAFQKEKGAFVQAIHPLHLLKNDQEVLNTWFDEAKRIIGNKKDLVITTVFTPEVAVELEAYIAEAGIDKLELGNQIASTLGAFASRLIKEVKVSGLILTGGDIAYQTCLKLDIHALEVMKEIEEGIPLSKVVGGPYADTAIVTKAGAFGQESSLHHAMDIIKNTHI